MPIGGSTKCLLRIRDNSQNVVELQKIPYPLILQDDGVGDICQYVIQNGRLWRRSASEIFSQYNAKEQQWKIAKSGRMIKESFEVNGSLPDLKNVNVDPLPLASDNHQNLSMNEEDEVVEDDQTVENWKAQAIVTPVKSGYDTDAAWG